jgi:hypothetical protein
MVCSRFSKPPRRLDQRRLAPRPAGPEKLVDFHHKILRHIDELGCALEIGGKPRPVGGFGDLRLELERRGRDAEVVERHRRPQPIE